MISHERIAALARKEVRHILRDWQTLVIVLIMPVLMMFLYGYALNADARNLPIAVETPSSSSEATAIIGKLDAGLLFEVAAVSPALAEPADLFRQEGVRALVRFPAGFAADLRRPGGTTVQVLVDGSDPNVGTLIRNAAEPLLVGAALDVLQVEAPSLVDLRTLILYNPEQKSALFFVPGLMAVILLMISALLTSIAITREKELGTMGQLLVSPVRPMEIMIGKILPYIVLAGLDGLLILGVGRLAFGVRVAGSHLFLLGASLIYIFTALSIGLLISTVAKHQQHAMFMALGATMMPSVLLSGFIFPVTSMPVALQAISLVIPATWFLEIVRGIILKGVGLAELWRPVAILSLEGAVLMALSIRKFPVKL